MVPSELKPVLLLCFLGFLALLRPVYSHVEIDYKEVRDTSPLVKLELVDVDTFVTQATVAAIFYYRTLQDLKWLVWLKNALPAIHPTPIGMLHCNKDGNYKKKDCLDLGISAPCIRIYRYGYTLGEYRGQENVRDFVGYVRKVTPNTLVRLDDWKTFEHFLDTTNVTAVIGFFKKETDLEATFIITAKVFRGPIFAYSSGDEVLRKMNYSDDIVLFHPKVLHNEHEPNFIRYTGEADMECLKEFIREYQHGLVGIRNFFDAHEFQKPQIIAYFDLRQNKQFRMWRNVLLPIAKKHPNIKFAVSEKRDFLEDLKDFGIEWLKVLESNILVIAQTDKNHRYLMEDPEIEEDLMDFVDEFENRKLAQLIKSQELEHSRPKGVKSAIYLAVGRNFLELVGDKSKDFLVMLYTFECFYELITVEFIADEHKDELNFTGFIAMNVDLNDAPYPYYFQSCPTIFFAGRGYKDKPVLYGGTPQYQKMYAFMKEQRRLQQGTK